MDKGKFVGSVLIVVGTSVGAGMLALPMVSASSGFILSASLLIVIWFLMMLSALLLLEVNLAFEPYKNHFSSMSFATLGHIGRVVSWISCLFLLYALISAYIAGSSSLLTTVVESVTKIKISFAVNASIFTVVLGAAVFWSTRTVDYLNRGLISIKGGLLVVAIILLFPHIDVTKLSFIPQHGHGVLFAIPIFLCAFGFHIIIPTLRNYVGPDVRVLKKIIIVGMFVSLIIYLLWLVVVLGIVPLAGKISFAEIAKAHGSIGGLMQSVNQLVKNKWVVTAVNGFSNIAMTTSFLGVALSLFDFLAEGFKRSNTRVGRSQTALLTFIPPLLFAIYYPTGFVFALGYAAIFVSILLVIFPALMAYSLRRSLTLISPYRVFGGTPLLLLILLVGIAFIVIQVIGTFY
jgi:tyrosine-specific transport protein